MYIYESTQARAFVLFVRTLTCPVISSGPSSTWVNISRCHFTGTISATPHRQHENKRGVEKTRRKGDG